MKPDILYYNIHTLAYTIHTHTNIHMHAHTHTWHTLQHTQHTLQHIRMYTHVRMHYTHTLTDFLVVPLLGTINDAPARSILPAGMGS